MLSIEKVGILTIFSLKVFVIIIFFLLLKFSLFMQSVAPNIILRRGSRPSLLNKERSIGGQVNCVN